MAQQEATNWYFGNYAGLSFASGSPVALLDGAMSTMEGVATISNSSGILLFYTDGQTIWNRQHQIMTNGTGLWGHSSSTQSGVIVKKPGSNNIFYVFTVDEVATGGIHGVCYSIVDMNLSGGLGAVTSKNIELVPNSNATEKITAVKHSNGTDIWVLTHGWNNNQFLAFKVTSSGINSTPIISNAGQIHSGINRHRAGYMKSSPNGSYIALTMYDYGDAELVEMVKFNPSNGTVSTDVKCFADYIPSAYGVEFSPDNTKLYASGAKDNGKIYQYNLSLPNGTSIVAGKTVIASNGNYAAMQVAIDGKIYVTRYNVQFLSCINSPNLNGIACNFTENNVSLGGRTATFGLPTFIQSFFVSVQAFSNSPVCQGNTIHLYCVAAGASSYYWTGPAGFTSTLQNPSIANAQPYNSGVYTVTAFSSGGNSATSQVSVVVNPNPNITLGPDTTICENSWIVLSPGSGFQSYLWNTGSTQSSIIVNSPGNYSVIVMDANGCSASDSKWVYTKPAPGPILIKHR
ncbi:MAG TPA: hypothetical protein VIO15_00420 [Bacteroidales bacterium]|jgi:hypothetical protein|nr:hypothetical protein [Bacteroidales bacterium]